MEQKTGGALAAFLAVTAGMLAMAITVGLSDANKAFETNYVHALGKLWVPYAQQIGPYSGKFTVLLLGWLISWPILHRLLHDKEATITGILIGAILWGISFALIWPPFTMAVFVH